MRWHQIDTGRGVRHLPTVQLGDLETSTAARTSTTLHEVYDAVHYACDWLGWDDPVGDLYDICKAQEGGHRRMVSRMGADTRGRQGAATAARFFVIVTICSAIDDGMHYRKIIPAEWMDRRPDYIKAMQIVRKHPWLSKVLPPRVRAVVAEWDYCEVIVGRS